MTELDTGNYRSEPHAWTAQWALRLLLVVLAGRAGRQYPVAIQG
jgi:hypothetical protein